MLTQDKETLHLQAGRYLRPVTFTREKSKWKVQFPYNRELVAEIKALDGARWNPDGKYWTIRDSARNRFALRLLQGGDLPWYHTPRPITDVERPLYTHQREMAAHILAKRRFLLIGEQGCVSGDTEFLSPAGWCRMDRYEAGTLVCQFDPQTGESSFVSPSRYIDAPCEEMVQIKSRGLSQMLSPEHRVLEYPLKGPKWHVVPAEDVYSRHQRRVLGAQARFQTVFQLRHDSAFELDGLQLRLQVAVIADGHFPNKSNACVVRLKKPRKIHRLRSLLEGCGLEYTERTDTLGLQVFRFQAPRREKVFGPEWWQCSHAQRLVVCDEVYRWGGSRKKAGAVGFYSSRCESADFVQYCFASTGRRASLNSTCRRGRLEYRVHVAGPNRSSFADPGRRKANVQKVPAPGGRKYCFTVPTGFLILRHNGCIFATGNCGKSLAAIEAMERSGVADWLIVGPRSALRAWHLEVAKWAPRIEPQFSTYESLYKLLASWKGAPPQGVIFDECSRIKNPSANRSRAARKLSEALEEHYQGEEFVVCMTGTPAPNTPADWWHQAETTRSGWLRESSRRKLEQRIAIFESLELPTGPVRKIIGWDPEEVELLGRRLEGLAHTWLKRDCLDLPEKVYETWSERPSEEMREAADLLVAGCTTAIESLTALRQLSDGFVGGERVPCPKDKMLEDLLDAYHERGRVIVFAAFHRSIDRILESCRLAGWDAVQYDGRTVRIHRADGSMDLSTDPVELFQSGEGRVAWVGHPKASGMGLTLTSSEVIAYWSNDFDAEARAQSEDRIHRPGCRGAKIIDFVHLPSDDLVRKKLKVKQDLQSITVEEIRKALQ